MFDLFHEFEVLAKRLDFEAAAKDLALSQPTLSRHIMSLENELGFKLFDRRPLRLTEAGAFLLESLPPVLSEAQSLIRQAAQLSQEQVAAPLVASMVDIDGLFSHAALAAAVKMKQLYSNFVLKLESDNAKSLAEMVYSKVSDIAFLPGKPTSVKQGFEISFVANDTLALWVHKDNPILQLQSPTLKDLANSVLVFSKNRILDSFYETVLSLFKAEGIPLAIRQKKFDMILEYIVNFQPDEILAFPSTMAGIQPDVINPDLRMAPLDPRALTYAIWALYPSDSAHPYIESFLRLCRSSANPA